MFIYQLIKKVINKFYIKISKLIFIEIIFLYLFFGIISLFYRINIYLNVPSVYENKLHFFLIGYSYDIYVISQLILILFIFKWLIYKYYIYVLLFFKIMWLIFNYINARYFDEFQTHLPLVSLLYLKPNEFKYLKSTFLHELVSTNTLSYLYIPCFLILIFIIKNHHLFNSFNNKINVSVLLIIGILSGSFSNSNVTSFIDPLQNNSLFYFILRSNINLNNQKLSLNEKEIKQWKEYKNNIIERKFKNTHYPFYGKINKTLKYTNTSLDSGLLKWFENKIRPNIVLLISESFNSDRIGKYNSRSYLSPHFDEFTKSGILFKNFYANSYQTMRGQFAILCGMYPNPGPAVLKNYYNVKLECISEKLKRLGYETLWIHSGDGNFDNQEYFFRKNGFNKIVTDKNFDKDLEKFSWGYPDEELMKKSIETLKDTKDPFFAVILTTSNHHPYEIPEINNLKINQKDSIKDIAFKYSDYSLGYFFNEVKKEKFYKDTFFILTSDTGSGPLNSGNNIEDLLKLPFSRIPLWLFWEKSKKLYIDERISSQVDIIPSIVDLLKINDFSHFLGQSLFREFTKQIYVKSDVNSVEIYEGDITYINGKYGQEFIKSKKDMLLKKILNYTYYKNNIIY